jgi:hypothetical protein
VGLFEFLFSSIHFDEDETCSRCGEPLAGHIRDGNNRYCPDDLDEDDWI